MPGPGVCNHPPGRSLLNVTQVTLVAVTPRARRKEGEALSAALQQRPDFARALKRAGAKRQRHLDVADEELERIVALASQAIEAGASVAEIAELAGVSRMTLYRLLK